MKKNHLSIILGLAFLLSFHAASASDNLPVDDKILASFHKTFGQAKEESWKKVNGFDVVNFRLDEKYLTAYYEQNGDLKAVTRNILADQLPLNLQAGLKDYERYWITNLFEMASQGETQYYVTVENAEETITLKSIQSSEWMRESKESKE
jgi:hypothetical protein